MKAADDKFLIKLDASVDLKNAANAIINPFTVIAQLDKARKLGSKAVIMTAATSALAKQFYKLA